MLYETHMHTPLCKHAQGSPIEYGRVAATRGLSGITVTCHNPLPDRIAPGIRMEERQWSEYLDLVAAARQALAPLTDVRLGLEADYMPGLEGYLERQLASAEFDYVLGSVHWHMLEWQQRFWTTSSTRELYQSYFEQLAMAAETRLFDCIAHPDLVKNASPSQWDFEEQRSLIESALDRIAATGVAMELNTSGRLKAYAEFNPGHAMLACMKARDIPVSIGSDAHCSERAGDGFAEALEALRAAGYQQVSMFAARQRYEVSISEALRSLESAQPAV